uniref:Glucan endo-1,3-beta-D-glucosidase n=1 Tax=Nelumbo nucifera TaxID=4432 RepID=A0A822YFV0_NELNU|nr:TPA_asm: hypothetical protein HUJ06_031577 [Nelumbo nucifera]
MFESMVDATYYSMKALNFSGIPIIVTESSWPWFGGAIEPDATADNARTYNNNLVCRVLNDWGPPCQPTIPIRTYIYELFNEYKRPGSQFMCFHGKFWFKYKWVIRASINIWTHSGVEFNASSFQDGLSDSGNTCYNWILHQFVQFKSVLLRLQSCKELKEIHIHYH